MFSIFVNTNNRAYNGQFVKEKRARPSLAADRYLLRKCSFQENFFGTISSKGEQAFLNNVQQVKENEKNGTKINCQTNKS